MLIGLGILCVLLALALAFSAIQWHAERRTRQATEVELRLARELASLASDWVWEQDARFRFTRFEGAALERMGVRPDQLIGRARWEVEGLICDPASMARHRAALERHEVFSEFEYGARQTDGSLRWYVASGQPRFSSAGEFLGYIGVAHEESRRHTAEDTTRQQHAELLEARSLAGLGTARWLRGQGEIDCSPQFLALLGLPPEASRQRWQALLGRLTPASRRAVLGMLRDTERTELSLTLQTEGPEPRYIELRARLLNHFQAPCWHLAIFDVSAIEGARALANEAQRVLEVVFENAPLPIAVSTLEEGRILRVNRAWLTHFGLTAEAAIGRTSIELGIWPSALERGAFAELAREHGQVSRHEVRQRHSTGREWLAELSGSVIELGGEQVFISSLVDVTEQRHLQHAAETANLELEALIQARTRDLERAMVQVVQSEKLAMLGGLVAGVAHELNSPLGNTLTLSTTLHEQVREFRREMSAGALRRSGLEQFLANSSEAVALIEHNCQRAASLMTSFKQAAADQTSEQRRPFDLQAVLNDAIAALRPRLARVPHMLELEIPEDIAFDSFPGPLEQIIINLVNNALLHAFDGHTAGRMRLFAPHVDPERVILVFEDNGMGMSEETAACAFQPFFTTRAGRGGTGLGLYIIRSLAEDTLGGTLRLETAPGEGSRFILTLPRVAPRVDAAAA